MNSEEMRIEFRNWLESLVKDSLNPTQITLGEIYGDSYEDAQYCATVRFDFNTSCASRVGEYEHEMEIEIALSKSLGIYFLDLELRDSCMTAMPIISSCKLNIKFEEHRDTEWASFFEKAVKTLATLQTNQFA